MLGSKGFSSGGLGLWKGSGSCEPTEKGTQQSSTGTNHLDEQAGRVLRIRSKNNDLVLYSSGSHDPVMS